MTGAGGGSRFDVFGFDPEFLREALPRLRWLATRFFRTRLALDAPPAGPGPVVYVANHGGFLPLDAAVLLALLQPADGGRGPRPLLEDFVFTLPYVGLWASRVGCVRACQENAVRLLEAGWPVLAFPEGVKGAGRTVFDRDRVMRFGRGGLVRLALRAGVPVVPIGIAGPDDAYPVVLRLDGVGRALGLPFLPVTPTFPLLGAAGLVPLPARFAVVVGDPIDLREQAGAAEPDEATVLRVNEHVRGRVADLVRRARREAGR